MPATGRATRDAADGGRSRGRDRAAGRRSARRARSASSTCSRHPAACHRAPGAITSTTTSGSPAATTGRPTSGAPVRTRRPRGSPPGLRGRLLGPLVLRSARDHAPGARAEPRSLDGFKFSFGPTSCGRSEATFNGATDNYGDAEQGEGAFVANLDGPVRAIRSYVGANSGPLTERTHAFYRDRYTIVTDLRVHAVPGPSTYHDLAAGGIGMTYLNSANRGGVAVDGNPRRDQPRGRRLAPVDRRPGLAAVHRPDRDRASPTALMAGASTWYLDDSTPAPNLQCWGDLQAYGQAGLRSTTADAEHRSLDRRHRRPALDHHRRRLRAGDDGRASRPDHGRDRRAPDRRRPRLRPRHRGAADEDREAPRRAASRPHAPATGSRRTSPRAGSSAASIASRWKRCGRKQVFRRLDGGGHRLRVRAVDPAGNADRTPAQDRFLVER